MRVYTVEFEAVSVTVAQDFFALVPGAQIPIKILGIFLSQSSDVGDAAEEILRIRVIRGHTTAGSGGTAPTPQPLDDGDAAATFTARVNDTTIASLGTAENIMSHAFNIRTGLELWFPPEACPKLNVVIAANRLVVRLMAAPVDALTMSGTIFVQEC